MELGCPALLKTLIPIPLGFFWRLHHSLHPSSHDPLTSSPSCPPWKEVEEG